MKVWTKPAPTQRQYFSKTIIKQRLAESGDFDAVYVSHVSGDAGLAPGSALLLAASDYGSGLDLLVAGSFILEKK